MGENACVDCNPNGSCVRPRFWHRGRQKPLCGDKIGILPSLLDVFDQSKVSCFVGWRERQVEVASDGPQQPKGIGLYTKPGPKGSYAKFLGDISARS